VAARPALIGDRVCSRNHQLQDQQAMSTAAATETDWDRFSREYPGVAEELLARRGAAATIDDARVPAPAETTAPPETPPPPPYPRWSFSGLKPHVAAAAARAGISPRLLPLLEVQPPIVGVARALTGLAERSVRRAGTAMFPRDVDDIRATLESVEECRWHYRLLAGAGEIMINEARSAAAPASDRDGVPPAAWPLDPTAFLESRAAALGLPGFVADRAKHSPGLKKITLRLGALRDRLQDNVRQHGVAVTSENEQTIIDDDLDLALDDVAMLDALDDAARTLVAEAYAAFGLGTPPEVPSPDMTPSRCCSPGPRTARR
jgi:hypothetical protein